jgi:hypothetical protein
MEGLWVNGDRPNRMLDALRTNAQVYENLRKSALPSENRAFLCHQALAASVCCKQYTEAGTEENPGAIRTAKGPYDDRARQHLERSIK